MSPDRIQLPNEQPASQGGHVALVTSDQPIQIVVGTEAPDGRWFKVLHWLVASKIWAQLKPHERSVLVALHHLADSENVAIASQARIGELAGYQRSAVSDAIKNLLQHPAGLLAAAGDGWAILPGKRFAGRQHPEPLRPGGRSSALADTILRPSGELSGPPDGSVVGHQRIPTSSPKTKDSTSDETVDRELAADLAREGFDPGDVRNLLARGVTRTQLAEARANADHIAAQPRGFKKSRKVYIAAHLQRGYELWDSVRDRRQKTWLTRMHEIVRDATPPSEQRAASLWLARLLRTGAITPETTEGLSTTAVLELLRTVDASTPPQPQRTP